MNKFSQEIIFVFQSRENVNYLRKSLLSKFENPNVLKYINCSMGCHVRSFAESFAYEFMNSDPINDVPASYYVTMLNDQFLIKMANKLQRSITSNTDRVDEPATFKITDGVAPKPSQLAYKQQSADQLLSKWKMNPGHEQTIREDVQGDNGETASLYYNASNGVDITFCDQSDVNLSTGDEYRDKQFNIINRPNDNTLYGGYVADGSIDTLGRLLQRNIFRKNEAGVPNGIPRYECRLYNRHLDRQISETLSGRERESKTWGYDMSHMYKRHDFAI